MKRPDRRGERGAAMVETAISLIVILPVVMYALLLTDLLQHQLDLQEVTLSSVWDYAYLDYEKSPLITDTERQNQLMWCDHTSVYDSYNKSYDCTEEVHHTQIGARVCWLDDPSNSGGKDVGQVTCTADKNVSRFLDPTARLFHGRFTQGGMFTCRAQMYAMNVFVPETILPEFGGGQMYARQRFDENDSTHNQGETAGSTNVFVYPRSTHALLTDTWSMNVVADELPGQNGPLQERAQYIFVRNLGFPQYTAAAAKFTVETQKELLLPGLALLRDANPLKANVALKKFSGSSGPRNQNYFSTPWEDRAGNENKQTWTKRGRYYLGCDSEESC